MVDAVVLPFRPRADAPVQPLRDARTQEFVDSQPRAHFGLRETDRPPPDVFRMAGGVERVLSALNDALAGKAPPVRAADPAERHEASGMLNAGAAAWRDVARYLESVGCITQARTAYDMADIAETLGAEVLIPVTPEGA